MKWFIGIFLFALGVVMVLKSEWLLSFFGRIAWAEEKLGYEGGTRLFYKLLGLGLILMAFMIISGRLFTIFDWIFARGS
jgi:hypothetical protein